METSRDGRFAPSPTADLHLGNLRTALLAWLFARSAGARFYVRVEDLDRSRVRPGIEARQISDFTSLGLDYDGEIMRQSERLELYESEIQALYERGLLYPCYCTRAEIRAEIDAASSAPHGDPTFYPGTCRDLSTARRRELEASGRRPALRFRASGEEISFEDGLLGRVEGVVDDFVVRRNDGSPSYQLAVVVDDAAQGIGEVVRGADLALSTPRQILLGRSLGLDPPTYAHVPLVLGSDGKRLAKRHGSVTLEDRTRTGDSVWKIRGWMAWTLGLAERHECPAMGEILARFDPGLIPDAPTIWSGALQEGDADQSQDVVDDVSDGEHGEDQNTDDPGQ